MILPIPSVMCHLLPLLRHIMEATLSLFLSPSAAADFPVPLASFLILS